MAGNAAGSASSALGYSQCTIEACVAVKFLGSMPHAGIVQYGAPEPPEKRDHCGKAVSELDMIVDRSNNVRYPGVGPCKP